uniref:Ge1_WD40 domain-containing protein n=1 Tax=Caenorhabditis tropicalis TaxID=1561998 RepID=A0A1I7TKJ0_9PELO
MADSHGLQSPEVVLEKYTISREKPSIGFEIGSNVIVQLCAPSDVDNGRERDSSNVHTKVIMDHKGDIQYLRGGILTSNGPIIGFRSIHESVGESLNLINLQTKQRHRFKDFPFRTIDLAFAHHHKFLAVLNADLSLYIFEVFDNCESKKYLSINNWPVYQFHGNDDQPHLSWCPYIQGDDDEEETSHVVSVYVGRQLYIVDIGVLKDAGLGDDIDFEDAIKEEKGLYTHTFNNHSDNKAFRISAVCISPDSTAVAIAKTDGPVQFFTFNEENNTLKDAHCFEPRGFAKNGFIDDLIFLDDLSPDRNCLPFWRSCVVVSDNGHKVALYECQTWRCLGRIRFETTRAINKFISVRDPSSNFIHLLDVDGMNVYTIEIMYPFQAGEQPRFVGITQTSFCHPIFSISAISSNTFENADDSSDDLFNNDSNEDEEDDESATSEPGETRMKHSKSKRYFVAMGKRSMVELQMTLKQYIPSPVSTQTTEKELSPSVYVDTTQDQLASVSELQGLLMRKTEPTASDLSVETINKKLDDVMAALVRIETERKETNDRMVQQIISALDENIRMREGYMLNRIEQLCENGRLDTIAALRSGISNLNEQIETTARTNSVETAEYISQRVGSSARNALTDCIIPSFERSCEVLFERLNEHFRHGINEYLTTTSQVIQGTAMATIQMAAQQQQQKQELDRIALLQLIETNPEGALEAALNKANESLLEFVCSKINPEKILVPENTKLSQRCLLALVSQFTVSLNRDRDLKFRWIELVIPQIDMGDPEISLLVTPVAQKLLMALQEVIENAPDEQVRRYVRLLYQLTRTSLLQPPTPSQRTSTSVLSKFLSDHSQQ